MFSSRLLRAALGVCAVPLIITSAWGLEHFRFDVTQEDMSLLILDAHLDGQPLAVGDEVGVFTPDGLCAGGAAVRGEGQALGLSAWGDNPDQEGIEGFRADEALAFRVWERESDAEYRVEGLEVVEGQDHFAVDELAVFRLAAFRGPDEPIIGVSTDVIDFGEVRLLRSGESALEIRNNGRRPLVIREIRVVGAPFATDFGGEANLGLMERLLLRVRFAPHAQGLQVGRLVIVSNDPDDGEVEVSLAGRGIPSLPPTLWISSDGLDFGPTPIRTNRTAVLTVQNVGDEALTISSVEIQGEGFVSDFNEAVALEYQQNHDIELTFSPTEGRGYQASLFIRSDDPNRNEVEVRLYGSGQGPRIAVSNDRLDFPETVVHDVSARILTIGNDGPVPLTLQSYSLDDGVFSSDIARLAQRERHFRANPTETDHSLLITEAWIEERPLDIGDEIGVFTPDGVCGGVTVIRNLGSPQGIAVWMDNVRTEEVEGFAVDEEMHFRLWDALDVREFTAEPDYLEGPGAFQADGFSVLSLRSGELLQQFDPPPLTIPAFSRLEVNLFFQPTEPQAYQSTLRLGSDDLDRQQLDLPLSGEGINLITVNPAGIEFGEVMIGAVVEGHLRFTNHSRDAITLTQVEFDSPAFWAVDPQSLNSQRFRFRPTDNDHSLLVRYAGVGDQPLGEGDEIGAFTRDGICCGATVVRGEDDAIGLAVWGDNPVAEGLQGYEAGDAFAFRFWDNSAALEIDVEPEYIEGPQVFTPDGMTILNLRGGAERRRYPLPQIEVAAGTSADLLIHFNPVDAGAVDARMLVETSCEALPLLDIPVSAVAIPAPDIRLSAQFHDYGQMRIGEDVDWELSVMNEGAAELNVHRIQAVGDGFSLPEPGGFRLDPGQSQVVLVRCNPTAVGQFSGRIFIDGDDPDEPACRVSLTGFAVYVARVEFSAGWNMISINVIPFRHMWRRNEGPDVRLMTRQLRSDPNDLHSPHHIILVKDERGRFYVPLFDYINIPFWNLPEGYQVKIDSARATEWVGERIPADADVPIARGWNLIAYFPDYELSARAPQFYVISPILDNVLLAKDSNGRFLNPAFNFSNMLPWRAGQGYQIKVDQDVTLNYPERQQMAGSAPPPEVEPGGAGSPLSSNHWTLPVPTGSNMSLLVTTFRGVNVRDGDQVGAFGASGDLIGVGTVQSGMAGVAVWGDDQATGEVDGLLDGEGFTLRIWTTAGAALPVELPLSVETFDAGSRLAYKTDDFVALSASADVIPTDYYLAQNHPNPFNALTRIAYGLPSASQVTLIVYDAAGRVATTLLENRQAAGNHSVVWDGTNASAGLYLVKMEAGEFKSVLKVVLVK